jgi:hypothetical protein
LAAQDGNIGWGDLFFNFSGKDFTTAATKAIYSLFVLLEPMIRLHQRLVSTAMSLLLAQRQLIVGLVA